MKKFYVEVQRSAVLVVEAEGRREATALVDRLSSLQIAESGAVEEGWEVVGVSLANEEAVVDFRGTH